MKTLILILAPFMCLNAIAQTLGDDIVIKKTYAASNVVCKIQANASNPEVFSLEIRESIPHRFPKITHFSYSFAKTSIETFDNFSEKYHQASEVKAPTQVLDLDESDARIALSHLMDELCKVNN